MPINLLKDFGRTAEVEFFVDCDSVLVCIVEELLGVFVLKGGFESIIVVWALFDTAVGGKLVV